MYTRGEDGKSTLPVSVQDQLEVVLSHEAQQLEGYFCFNDVTTSRKVRKGRVGVGGTPKGRYVPVRDKGWTVPTR